MHGQDLYKGIDLPTVIDKNYLYSLYEDDYQYLEQVFFITLEQLREDLQQMQQLYKKEDLVQLRKAVHKLKPSFGFVGLLDTQESCRQFEDLCAKAGSVKELDGKYKDLVNNLIDTQSVINLSYEKIKSYNANK